MFLATKGGHGGTGVIQKFLDAYGVAYTGEPMTIGCVPYVKMYITLQVKFKDDSQAIFRLVPPLSVSGIVGSRGAAAESCHNKALMAEALKDLEESGISSPPNLVRPIPISALKVI